jgi:3-phenylpropionate/cinnamic acid dioxygenase small subunit
VSRADDRAEIETLLYEYAARLDGGDLERMAALFRHSTYRAEGSDVVLRGSDEVLAAQRHVVRLYDGSPRTHHHITNVVVDVEGDTATSRAYYTVWFAPPGSPPRAILTGRYHDRFDRVGGVWRFADRLATFDQVGDLSEHLHLDRVDLDLEGAPG